MITEINDIEGVRLFFKQLLDEGLDFHPDTPFEHYINCETGKVTYTANDAKAKNKLTNVCFEVCEIFGVDIYELSIEIFQQFNQNNEVI